jgi:Peptidase A4 family
MHQSCGEQNCDAYFLSCGRIQPVCRCCSGGSRPDSTANEASSLDAPHTHQSFSPSAASSDEWERHTVDGLGRVRQTFTSVTASGTVPTADCALTISGPAGDEASFWVGLDGQGNQTVEQNGFSGSCDQLGQPLGQALYWTWAEMARTTEPSRSGQARRSNHGDHELHRRSIRVYVCNQ